MDVVRKDDRLKRELAGADIPNCQALLVKRAIRANLPMVLEI